jgi:hypothetical protein
MRRNACLTSLCLAAVSLLLVTGGVFAARSTGELTTEGVLKAETSLGDLVADAVQEAGGAEAALVNATQFKPGTVPAGKVGAADISALLTNPGRAWGVSQITGACLKAALERSLSRVPADSAHFLQVAGLKVTYNPDATPGTRVTSLKIGAGLAAVQDGKSYRIAMPEDLAKGGSGYFTIPCFNKDTIQPGATGTLAEAIAAYVEAHAVLEYTSLSRIVAAAP